MRDTETAAVFRAVLHELCANLAPSGASTKTHAAAKKPLETVQRGPASIDRLKETRTAALRRPPTMWR